MSNEMLNLINQARAQARNDGLKNFLVNNAKLLTRFALILVVVGISFFVYRSYERSNEAKFSEILHKSLINQQIGDIAKAKENLKEIYEAKSAPSGVKSLASLRYAAFFLEEGNKSEAAKVYLSVHECGSCDDYVRDLAGLLAVKVWVIDAEEMKKADLVSRIEKIENNSSILKYHVAEQLALLELQKGELEKSYQTFERIAKAPESAQAIKSRAEDGMKMVISAGFNPKVEAEAAPQTDVKS